MVDHKTPTQKPKVSGIAERELEKAEKQLDEFQDNVKELTLDRMNQAPKLETEPTHGMSVREQQKSPDIYLKPVKTITGSGKFNERFREDYNFMKEYVQFIAENHEVGGLIEKWTRPFGGMPAEYWEVPCNKPVWGPRYLAEEIKKCSYHRLIMNETAASEVNHAGSMYGKMVVDTTIQRLDARPVSSRKSVFMGANF